MKYDFQKLNDLEFERMIQSLSRKVLGYGTITFGEGTDGGREATFLGEAPFPSQVDRWSGSWIIQAKFKSGKPQDAAKEFTWLKEQISDELLKFKTRKSKVEVPDNYLMFTNIVLTAKANTGTRDKATLLEKNLAAKFGIKNIRIISADDIFNYLESNRDVAIAYAPFILPGDVLATLLDLLNVENKRKKRINQIIARFIEIEFLEDGESKLDHAGKLTEDKVALEKVFIDLKVDYQGGQGLPHFIQQIIWTSDHSINQENQKHNSDFSYSRFALIAGPGYGKSTLTQFLAQIFRAYYSKQVHKNCEKSVQNFIQECENSYKLHPRFTRLPFKISLKHFAKYLQENTEYLSVLGYISREINRKCDSNITSEDLELIFEHYPSLFIFDGLDEVPTTSNRDVVLNIINVFTNTILKRLEANTIIVATSRPQGYTKEFDSSQYKHVLIKDLDKIACLTYLKKLTQNLILSPDDRADKLAILEKAIHDPEVSRLMLSPLQASIMTILVKSGGEPPRKKFELFTNYYDTIFRRERQRGLLKVLEEYPEYIKNIHNQLGLYLQTVSEKNTNPAATITATEFEQQVASYLISEGSEEERLSALVNEIIATATNRLVFISELQDQQIGFAIRSLQEYFAALGYLRSASDNETVDKLGKIVTNAYWSNTLLFSFGYLADSKPYMNAQIESLCYELNGSSNNPRLPYPISSMIAMGSQIALNILIEGIFRGHRKVENKFINLLGSLFSIPYTKKHQDITRLPKELILDSIFFFIEKKLSENRNDWTCWSTLSLLNKNIYNIDKFINNYWPNENNLRLNIYKETTYESDLELLSEKFIEDIPDLIVRNTDIFNEMDVVVLNAIATNPILRGESKRVFFELLFARLLNQSERQIYIESLRELGPVSDLLEFFNQAKVHSINLNDSYSYEIIWNQVTKDDAEGKFSISELWHHADFFDSTLYKTLFHFLIEQNFETFCELKTAIQLTKNPNYFYNVFVKTNPLLLSFKLNEEISENEFSKNKLQLENLVSTRKNSFKLFLNGHKYAYTRRLSSDNLFECLRDFLKKFSKLPYSANSKFGLRYFLWVFGELDSAHAQRLKDLTESQKTVSILARDTFETNDSFSVFNLLTIIYFLDTNILYAKVSSELDQRFDIISGTSYLGQIEDLKVMEAIEDKVIKVIKYQCLMDQPTNSKLLTQVTLLSIQLSSKWQLNKLPFADLRKNRHESIWKYILLCMDSAFSTDDLSKLKLIFEKQRNSLLEDRNFTAVLSILRLCFKNIFFPEIIQLLNSFSLSELQKRALVSIAQDFVESRPTNVELNN